MENKMIKWVIDPAHSEMTFKVRHMMISTVSGFFTKFNAEVMSQDEDFKDAQVTVTIDVASLNTNNADRDAHLRSNDFFNAEQYPDITFTSSSFDGKKLTGILTIRDISKEVTMDVNFNGIVTDPYGQTKAGFEIRGDINRKDFNLNWNAITEAGNIVVADKVRLEIDAQFVKQQ